MIEHVGEEDALEHQVVRRVELERAQHHLEARAVRLGRLTAPHALDDHRAIAQGDLERHPRPHGDGLLRREHQRLVFELRRQLLDRVPVVGVRGAQRDAR